MVEAKPTSYLLPATIRQRIADVHHRMPQRKLDRILLGSVIIGALYCLSITFTPYRPHSYIQNVFMNTIPDNPVSLSDAKGGSAGPTEDRVTWMPTPTRAWSMGTTMRSAKGDPAPNFKQPLETTIVVREGSDVQLDCKIAAVPHAIVTWYRGKEEFLTMGRRVYTDHDHIDIAVDEENLNWALRIREATLEDSGKYACHLALSANDVIRVTLDVLPRKDGATPTPSNRPAAVSDLYTSGFTTTPSQSICQNQGAELTVVIAVTSHPLYLTSRDRIRETWGAANLTRKDVDVVFGFGTINPSISEKVDKEVANNGDLVIGRYKDISVEPNTQTFHQLNLLQWVVEKCSKAKHTLLVTHNQFVNIDKLRKTLEGLDPEEKVIRGSCEVNTTVIRDPSSPNYLSYAEFQQPTLPQFCEPPAVLLTRSGLAAVTNQLLQEFAIPKAHLMLTGLAAESAGVKRIHLPAMFKQSQRIETCEYTHFIAANSWGKGLDTKVAKAIADEETCE